MFNDTIFVVIKNQHGVLSSLRNGLSALYLMMQKLIVFMRKVFFKLPVILFDSSAIPVAWYAAYWLRYNMHPYPKMLTSTHSFIGVIPISSRSNQLLLLF